MAGLAIFIGRENSNKNIKNILNNFMEISQIPGIKYSEKHISTNNDVFYNCLPNFIKEKKISQFGKIIIAYDGDFYNLKEINSLLQKYNLSKLELIYYLYRKYGDD